MVNAEIVYEPPLNSLAILSEARTQLASIRTVDEAKKLRDKAESARAYAKKINASQDVVNECAAVKLEAERRAGELLREMEKQYGSRGTGKKVELHRATSLADLGIEKTQSHRWQRIASIPEEDFRKQIEDTLSKKAELTTSRMLKFAKAIEKSKPTGTLKDISSGTFRCIYADPPWRYGNQGTRAATDNHYKTMTVDEICNLQIDDGRHVKDLAADDAHLHLWTTNAFLFDAKKVIEAWGFEYKSCLVWVKPQMGIGNYWRVSHEFLLFAIRGKLEFQDKAQKSWIEAKREQHSTKPQVFRSVIEKVSPGPRIELFARGQYLGWECWGNQS